MERNLPMGRIQTAQDLYFPWAVRTSNAIRSDSGSVLRRPAGILQGQVVNGKAGVNLRRCRNTAKASHCIDAFPFPSAIKFNWHLFARQVGALTRNLESSSTKVKGAWKSFQVLIWTQPAGYRQHQEANGSWNGLEITNGLL